MFLDTVESLEFEVAQYLPTRIWRSLKLKRKLVTVCILLRYGAMKLTFLHVNLTLCNFLFSFYILLFFFNENKYYSILNIENKTYD